MLKHLSIKSLGLIDHLELDFHEGFSCITGETGSGKTSLIEAIKLTLGKKSDFELIKQGSKKAEVTTIFELEANHPIYPLLNQLELSLEPGEPLILTRILLIEGKSKALLNQQPISLHTLSTLGPHLCQFIDQNDLFKLHDQMFYHDLIDQAGNLGSFVDAYKKVYDLYKEKKALITALEKKGLNKEVRFQLLEEEVTELKQAQIKDNEEQELFERYKKLQLEQDLIGVYDAYAQVVNQNLLPQLKKIKNDKSLPAHFQELSLSCFEQLSQLSQLFETSIDPLFDTSTLQKIQDRLQTIHRLKKKYGTTLFEECLKAKQEQITLLFSLEDDLKTEKAVLEHLGAELKQHSQALTLARQEFAITFATNLEQQLSLLNMPFAQLEFVFKDAPYHDRGSCHIELFIRTNSSNQKLPLLQGTSGGELARVNFCFFLELAKQGCAPTYIFDEIDAHVGGVTSSMMGEKLQELSKNKQIFCITHFCQMALKSSHHLVFSKVQDDTSTHITTHYSDQGPAQFEIDRMIGLKV